MEASNDKVRRLDLAARVEATQASADSLRWRLLILTACCLFLAMDFGASTSEDLCVWGLAVLGGLTTAALWTSWRFKYYLGVIFFLGLGLDGVLVGGYSHTATADALRTAWLAPCFIIAVYLLWRQAQQYAIVNGPAWESERAEVGGLALVLTSPRRAPDVIEFSTGNFWTGYFTYRLLSSGPCWFVAKFKRGNIGRLLDYRVRRLSEVSFARKPGVGIEVKMGKKTMLAEDVSSTMLELGIEPPLSKTA